MNCLQLLLQVNNEWINFEKFVLGLKIQKYFELWNQKKQLGGVSNLYFLGDGG